MSPSPNQNPRYRSGMPGQPGMGQMPAGGPPSYNGGTPSGSQPAGAGQQQRMRPPWMAGANPPEGSGNAVQAPSDAVAPQGSGNAQMGAQLAPAMAPAPQPSVAGQMAQQQGQPRMTPPWMNPSANGPGADAPMGNQPGQRPQYQGGPGPMQRAQMSAPQAPGGPMSQRQMNQRQPGM